MKTRSSAVAEKLRDALHYTNLLVFMEEVTNYIDSGYPVDVIYLDFQKAFNKVPHKRLAMKLAAHGIDGELLRWIVNWLSDRRQRVYYSTKWAMFRLERCIEWCSSGIICIGPLLFVIYLNDIDDSVACKILKFADDTKIYRVVKSADDIGDLYNRVSWSKDWQMLFNVKKSVRSCILATTIHMQIMICKEYIWKVSLKKRIWE